MYIFNSFNYVPLKSVVVDCLKAKGVKYKLPKKAKDDTYTGEINFGPKVFQMPLHCLTKTSVPIKGGQARVEVPEFLVETCALIEPKLHLEGIFRKNGSAVKQRELKTLINSGKPLDESYHIIDICNIIKLFFRELPEPLLPFYCHEMLLNCLIFPEESAQKEALLLSCLLLNLDHLSTLTFFMEFLNRVSQAAAENKMDVKNLAIVFAPSLMPMDSKPKFRSNLNINHHIAVVEMLIRFADELGSVPGPIAAQTALRRTKKRRSASITRMFTGIRKMVARTSPERNTPGTPNGSNTQRKRKSTEVMPPAVTVKRRREVADTTPRLCRMGGYSQTSLRLSENLLRDKVESPELRRKSEGATAKDLRDDAAAVPDSNRDIKKLGLKSSKSTSNLIMSKKKSLERKLSQMTWKKRRSSPKISPQPELNSNRNEEVVVISKREYEEMKTRVSSMEKLLEEREKEDTETNRLSLEPERLAAKLDKDLRLSLDLSSRQSPAAAVDASPSAAVQEAFEKTVVQSEQIGPQISKDLRLRWSSERRVARSPSERKIGSIRRRSRELARSHSAGPRTNLQRGRPNTRQTGLRSPRELHDPKRGKFLSQSPNRTKWKSAAVAMSPALRKLNGTPDRRDSIVSIRRYNVGMVQAKAKFFDSLHHSTDADSDRSCNSMEMRLESVKVELGVQSRPPAIKGSLIPALAHGLKTPLSQTRPIPRLRTTPMKVLPDVTTPRRSPRILARSQFHPIESRAREHML